MSTLKGRTNLDKRCIISLYKASSQGAQKTLIDCALSHSFIHSECGRRGPTSRIVNGVDGGHGEFPWLISLRKNRNDGRGWGHACGGSLLTDVRHSYQTCQTCLTYSDTVA